MDARLREIICATCELGCLLPKADTIDCADAGQVAEAKVLTEFDATVAAMWARVREQGRT